MRNTESTKSQLEGLRGHHWIPPLPMSPAAAAAFTSSKAPWQRTVANAVRTARLGIRWGRGVL